MEKIRYISVILPLKLEWEPCYALRLEPSSTVEPCTGDRVKVKFAHHEYVGVISRTDMVPDIDPKKIHEIVSLENGLERILPEEIALWRAVAEYYMCTVGEV